MVLFRAVAGQKREPGRETKGEIQPEGGQEAHDKTDGHVDAGGHLVRLYDGNGAVYVPGEQDRQKCAEHAADADRGREERKSEPP